MTRDLAYLGPEGTFTEEAALMYDAQAHLIPLASIASVGESVQRGLTQEGVVPIENSLEGSVNDTLDVLIQQVNLFIRKEMVLSVRHCLLGQLETRLEDVRVVYSHPQALAQCRGFLARRFPGAQLIAALSTAAGVEEMMASRDVAVAIGTKRAGELYGAKVFGESIQDSSTNVTRFVVLALGDHEPTGNDKTSLCLSFSGDKPGLLYSVLGEFAQRNVNLTKIESRPTKETLGTYKFLIDLEGHRQDALVQELIGAVREKTASLRIMGSYPCWQ